MYIFLSARFATLLHVDLKNVVHVLSARFATLQHVDLKNVAHVLSARFATLLHVDLKNVVHVLVFSDCNYSPRLHVLPHYCSVDLDLVCIPVLFFKPETVHIRF